MPEPTATELAKEAEQEAAVFSQAVNVEKLLNMLRAMDPAKDNLADNEEIQVCSYFAFGSTGRSLLITGAVSLEHGSPAKDCQAHRQVQSETRYELSTLIS